MFNFFCLLLYTTTRIELVSEAYQRLKRARDIKWISGTNNIYSYDPKKEIISTYPYDLEKSIISALKDRRITNLNNAVDVFFHLLKMQK